MKTAQGNAFIFHVLMQPTIPPTSLQIDTPCLSYSSKTGKI
jgi:hypothetical protein